MEAPLAARAKADDLDGIAIPMLREQRDACPAVLAKAVEEMVSLLAIRTAGTGISVGSFTACCTSLQRAAGIADDPGDHNEDIGKFRPDLEPRNDFARRRFPNHVRYQLLVPRLSFPDDGHHLTHLRVLMDGAYFKMFVNDLAPALQSAGTLLDQLGQDNAALTNLVETSDRYVGELAAERERFARMVEVLAGTATTVAGTTATLGANLTSNGGAAITARGTVWGTAANPTEKREGRFYVWTADEIEAFYRATLTQLGWSAEDDGLAFVRGEERLAIRIADEDGRSVVRFTLEPR